VPFVRASVLLAAVTAVLAVPLVVLAGGSAKTQAAPSFAFGRTGGNIVPSKVVISSTGRVTSDSSVPVNKTPVSLAARNGLVKLAKAEGFFTMTAFTACSGTLPDIAAQFVTVTVAGKTRTVTVHGGCVASFNELYAVLGAVAGAGP